MTIKELMKRSHETAITKGWWDLPIKNGERVNRNFGELMTLVHAEISEAFEEYRNGHETDEIYYAATEEGSKPEGVAVELADVLIRIADTCEHYNIPLEQALKEKMAYNRKRPYRHGGKRA